MRLALLIFVILPIAASAQKTDTLKCYVQIMHSFENTIGMSKNIEDNSLHRHGGMLLYTKAYAIKEDGKYVKFLSVKKKELKDIWKPNDQPQVMMYNW